MEIKWTCKALKQLRRIDIKEQDTIVDGVEELQSWPACSHVKSLKGRNDYRIRIGRYRVIFTVSTQKPPTIIKIEEVKKRDERTYSASNNSR